MALTATLTADFSAFIDAAKDSNAALKELKTTAGVTGGALDDMSAGYSTGAAVAETKSLTSALTEATTTAATTAPALDDISAASDTAGASATSFTQAYNQVDKSLKAAGIGLGPIPGALDEITKASGKTITELGLLGTAGAVAAAGLAGWNIGRWVADLTGADEWISKTTASLMGWGDVASQEAAAGAETLARASAIAGREITNMAEAVSLLDAEALKVAEDLKLSTAAAEVFAANVSKLFGYDDINRAEEYRAALGGVQNVSKLTTEAKKELNTAVKEAIAAYTALGQKAPAELVKIELATRELLKTTEVFSAANSGMWVQYAASVEEGSARIAKFIAAAKLGWEDIGGVSKAMLEQVAADAAEQYAVAQEHSEHFTGKQIADFRRAAAEAKAAVDAWGTDTIEAYDAIAEASSRTADVQIADAQRAAAATTLSWSEAMQEVQRGQGTLGGTVGGAVDLSGANRAAMQKAWDEGRYFGPVANVSEMNPRGTGPDFARLGFRATGGPVSAGSPYMVGERGPELFVPNQSGSIRANGGVTVNNTITVTGGTETLARQVADEIMRTVRAGTQLGTA